MASHSGQNQAENPGLPLWIITINAPTEAVVLSLKSEKEDCWAAPEVNRCILIITRNEKLLKEYWDEETIREFNIKLKQRFLDKMPGWSWWSSRDASQVNCCGWNWNWNKNNCKYFVKLRHCNTILGTLPSLGGDIKYFNSIIYCVVYTLNTNYTIRMHLLFLMKYIFAC